jgi:hypothetical protein
VTTNISVIDNVQTLHDISIKETELALYDNAGVGGNQTSADRALENYQAFGSLLFNLLSGFTMDPKGWKY